MAYLEFFPPEFIALQQEICNHPVLQKRLQKHHDIDAELQFSKCIAEICAYCNIAIDGNFDEKMLMELSDVCTKRLRSMGAELVVTGVSSIVDVSGIPIVKH